ncbi:MAG TPA: Uma2 family endonuclease [Dehalococcoidia bacterium]|nr:Uma2 family endonuclease [Dehalococcoidia bacterium]
MVATTPVAHILEAAELRPLSADEFMQMIAAGILDEDERVELIEGVMIKMSPINPPHGDTVEDLGWTLARALPESARIRIQSPIRVSGFSLPEPDIAIVRANRGPRGKRHPEPSEIFLVVEVSDSTLRFDRTVKLPLYARAGIPEVWIVDLVHLQLLVFRASHGDGYTERLVYGPNDMVAPLAFPEIRIEVASLLPEQG